MSTERTARALARAGRAARLQPNQPRVDPIEGGARDNALQENVEMTNKMKYEDATHFTDMLMRIGVTRACINQLQTDDFNTMKAIVSQYKGDVDDLETYLKNVNKSMANAVNPTRFSPIVMDRMLAVIHHFIQAVHRFHTIPDMEAIDRERSMELIDTYRMCKEFRESEIDDEVLIELPELKGHDNWITYRDKFLSNLHITPGSNGTPLSYIVDDTPRVIQRSNQPHFEPQEIRLDSWEIYSQSMVHFGAHYKKDNAKVWHLLKRSLLGNQPYHHIDHCARQENGRLAWNSLRSYYEGEDYVNRTIQECLTKVRTMYYRGETPRFNFEKFIDKQKECYKRLRDVGYNNGDGVDDATKCSNLKQMILPDAQLETALSMARTQGLFNGRFDDLVHFLKAEVDELALRRSQHRANRSHRISAVGSSRNGGRGGRGRGGRGPNRRFPPRNNRNRTILTRFVDGRQVHSGNYSPDEYRRLTPQQREAVKSLRQQARQQGNNPQGDQSTRRVSISGIGTSNRQGGDERSSQSSTSTVDNAPSSSGVSTITAPSGGVGSYLGSRRGQRDNESHN